MLAEQGFHGSTGPKFHSCTQAPHSYGVYPELYFFLENTKNSGLDFTGGSSQRRHISVSVRSCSRDVRWSRYYWWSSWELPEPNPPWLPHWLSPQCSSGRSCWPRCLQKGRICCSHRRKYLSLEIWGNEQTDHLWQHFKNWPNLSTFLLSPLAANSRASSNVLHLVRRQQRPRKVPPPREVPQTLSYWPGPLTDMMLTPDPMLTRMKG